MWTRRDYLKAMLAVGTTTGLGLPLSRASEQDPDVILRIVAKPDTAPIWKGEPTPIFRYAGEVIKGRRDALRPSGNYLGPTLDLLRGERVRIHFENRLDEASVIHWHGMIAIGAAIMTGQLSTFSYWVLEAFPVLASIG